MSKHAEAIEMARRAYVDALGTTREMATFRKLMDAVDAAKRKGKR